MPNIHPLIDPAYKPYDIGQVGQLDVHILTELFGGDNAARDLTPAWNGGLYWAGQLRSATTPAEQADTASIGSLLSFGLEERRLRQCLRQNLRQQPGAANTRASASLPPTRHRPMTAQWSSSSPPTKGPVLITTRGKMVFISESFPLPLARKLTALILDAQGAGPMHMARAPLAHPCAPSLASDALAARPQPADLVHFFAEAGVMKSVVDAERWPCRDRSAGRIVADCSSASEPRRAPSSGTCD